MEPQKVTWGEATQLDPVALAVKLLPSETSRKVVGGRVVRKFVPGQQYWVGLWERAHPVGPMLCQRLTHSLELTNATAAERPPLDTPLTVKQTGSRLGFATSYPLPATGESCARLKSFVFAQEPNIAATVAALALLTTVMDKASGTTPLPFKITCNAPDGDPACVHARASLATLPLDALFGVTFQRGLTSATVEFGRSGLDGASWRIALVGFPSRLTEVRMTRSQIIYH